MAEDKKLPPNPFKETENKEAVWKELLANARPISKEEAEKRIQQAIALQQKDNISPKR